MWLNFVNIRRKSRILQGEGEGVLNSEKRGAARIAEFTGRRGALAEFVGEERRGEGGGAVTLSTSGKLGCEIGRAHV